MAETQTESLLDAVTKHVFLVMLRISWPKMSYQIDNAVVEVAKEGNTHLVDKNLHSAPQWRLMPEKWRKRLVSLESKARATLRNASVHFATRGVSVLPVTRAEEVFNQLREHRDQMNRYRDEFTEQYSLVLDDLKDKLDPTLYNAVLHKLPSEKAISDKFGVIWAIIPVGGSKFFRPEQIHKLRNALRDAEDAGVVSAVDARKMLEKFEKDQETPSQYTDAVTGHIIKEARQQMESLTREAVERMIEEPKQVLADAVSNLLKSLNKPDRMIRSGTLDRVRRAFELVEGFEFLATGELLDSIRECRGRLEEVSPTSLNRDRDIGSQLAQSLRAVQQQAVATVDQGRLVKKMRRIEA